MKAIKADVDAPIVEVEGGSWNICGSEGGTRKGAGISKGHIKVVA